MIILFDKLIFALATWFGCGLAPRAPGTAGTLGAIPLVYLMAGIEPVFYMAAVLLFAAAAMVVAQFFESGGEHDPAEFVMDEVAGFMVAMTWVPFSWAGVVAGFALFRLFDIWKPFPISWIDRRIKGGVGTVADDLVAGIFANIAIQVLIYYGVVR